MRFRRASVIQSADLSVCNLAKSLFHLQLAIVLALICAFAIPSTAATLTYDTFSGPVANASGQFPTQGTSPWVCSGPGFASCIRGNGQMTTSSPAAGTIYYLMHTSQTPAFVRYKFTDPKEAPTFVIAVTRDGSLDNMWHADGFSPSSATFAFRQSYWCNEVVGCSASMADVTPAQAGGSVGRCPATIANHSYIGSLSFYGDTAVTTLQDGVTGALLCSQTASDPKLQSLIGPNFYLETFYGSPNVVFTSVEADNIPPPRLSVRLLSSASNVRAVANAVDASLLNNGTVFRALLSQAPGSLADSLAQLSGEIATIPMGAATSISSDFMNVMLGPLSQTRGGASRSGLGSRRDRTGSDRFETWITGYGEPSEIAGDTVTGAHRQNQTRAGVAIGFGYMPSTSFTFGAAVGQAKLDWSLSDIQSSGNADVTQAGLYAAAHGTRRYLDLGISYSGLSIKNIRTVTLAGPNQYGESYHASDIGARLEAGQYLWQQKRDLPLMLYVAAEIQSYYAPAFSEKTFAGTEATALTFESIAKSQVFTDLGLRIEPLRLSPNTVISAGLAWRHRFSRSQTANAIFIGDPSTQFVVAGAPLDANGALASVASDFDLARGFTLGIAFNGEFGRRSASYGGMASLRHTW